MKISGENFIKELKNKNPKALNYLVDNYSNLIFKVIISVLGSDKREDAVECLNDVILKAWQKIQYHDESKSRFSSWLIAVSKYNAIDYKRRLSKINDELGIEELELSDPRGIEERVLLSESKEEILRVIEELGSPDREIFIRKYFMEESINEISNSLKVTESAVNNRLYRGKKLLREKLALIKGEVV